MTERVSKTYNIHYLRMNNAKWEALQKVYARLPGFEGWHDGVPYPYWFGAEPGDNEPQKSHLWAPVEPSGLLVAGQLDISDWIEWQQVFEALATAAVGFEVKSAEDDEEWPYA